MVGKVNISAKALLYYATQKHFSLSLGNWFRGYLHLTGDFLNICTANELHQTLIRIPLQLIADAEELDGEELFLSNSFKVGLLKVDKIPFHDWLNHKSLNMLFLAGPKNIFKPFWDRLLKKVKQLNSLPLQNEMFSPATLKILLLLSGGIMNIKKIAFLLDLNEDTVLSCLHWLYKNKLIDPSGKLTWRGFREILKFGEFSNQFNSLLQNERKINHYDDV